MQSSWTLEQTVIQQAQVEQFFDDINIFEDEAQDRVAGKLVEVFTQIGLPAGAGAKLQLN